MNKWPGTGWLLILSALLGCVHSVESKEKSPPPNERIEQRVKEMYAAIQAKQPDKVAQYVQKSSRAKFKSKPLHQIFGYSVAKVEIEQNGKSAVVLTNVKIKGDSPFLMQIDWPEYTRWKLEGREWFWDPDNPPQTLSTKMQENVKNQKEKGVPSQVRFEKKHLDFGIVAKGKKVTLRWPFVNSSDQTIQIAQMELRGDFLKDVTEKKEFKPQESGEVTLELDTGMLVGPVDHSILVEFKPGDEIVQLRFRGKIFKQQDLDTYTPPK